MTNDQHLNDPETYAIIGAAMAVHTELGCGFLEAVYKAALASELRRRGVPFDREVALPIMFRGEPLPLSYRVDFICADAVIVEVKAHDALTSIDLAQAINYLRAARLERGLLLNFGATSLEHRRVVWGHRGKGRVPVEPQSQVPGEPTPCIAHTASPPRQDEPESPTRGAEPRPATRWVTRASRGATWRWRR